MNSVLLHSTDEEVRRAGVAALRTGEEELSLLIEALGDVSWRVRKEAVGRAATWADRDQAASFLVVALSEPENVGRRNAVIEALSRIGRPAVAPLVAALATRPDHRKLIVDTLGLIGDRTSTTSVVPSLNDDDPNVRAAAAEALGLIGGHDAEVALLLVLERGELLLSLASLTALNRLAVALPVWRLAPLCEIPVLLPAALAALGGSRDAGAARLLSPHLASPSRAVREAATVALETLRNAVGPYGEGRARVVAALREPPEAVSRQLVQAMLEGQPETRRAAAALLGLSGAASAVRPLVLALADDEVEGAAAGGLAALGPIAVGPLAELAGRVEPPVRLAILRLLPSLPAASDPRMVAVVEAAVEDDDDEIAQAAAHALGAVGGRDQLPRLFGLLPRPAVSASAVDALIALGARFPADVRPAVLAHDLDGALGPDLCRILGACGTADDAALLERVLAGGSPPRAAAAVEALGRLVGEAALPSIERALGADSPEVRAAAVRALSAWPVARGALTAREPVEDDPLVRAVIAAALALPPM